MTSENRGLSVRVLSERHGVSRHTIRRALDAPRLAEHELTRRRPPPAIPPLKSLIDPLLDDGLNPKEIWVRVIDQHHIVVPFIPLTTYAKEWHASRVRETLPMPHPPLGPQ